jgi:putative isomerase
MERRSFLRGLAITSFSGLLPRSASLLLSQTNFAQPTRQELSEILRTLLVTSDPVLYDFATEVYATCILGKIKPPDPPLAHPWIVPGGGYYAQWLWDTMFVLDLLAVLPNQSENIRGVFQNYWDFQSRWNAVKSPSQHGMVGNFMAPFDGPAERSGKDWQTFPAYSQAPLLAWGMERVYLRNRDRELLSSGLAALESFHDWYWRERDVTGVGLVGVGAYSGDVQHARYETYDHEVDLDNLKLTPHPGRQAGSENGSWYGDILIPANTAYLLLSELSLARMATSLGDHAMAGRRRARYLKGALAMRTHMWSQQQGCFLSVHRDTLTQIPSATVGGFMPLLARVPTIAQARAMASTLAGPAWATPLPIPTVARTNPSFSSAEFWRGDSWPAPNYQVATGLAMYGQHSLAARIADATVENALKVGISERYDSLTGNPLGVHGLGMSATTLTMLLDGLTRRYNLRVRNQQHAVLIGARSRTRLHSSRTI